MDPLLEKLQEVSEVMETFGKLYFFKVILTEVFQAFYKTSHASPIPSLL